MSKPITTREDKQPVARVRKPPLRPHTFGTWKAIESFYKRQPPKMRRYPTVDELVKERALNGEPVISRQAVHKQVELLVEAGKVVRRGRMKGGRNEITWVAPFKPETETEQDAMPALA